MMTNYCSALEAILFAAGEPVPVSRISLVLGIPEEIVEEAATELENVYREANHGISMIRISDKLQLCSSAEYASVITKILEQRKPPSLSPAALETLAVVAYYQPRAGFVASTGDECLSPRVRLECSPEIPVAPGEDHWLLDTSLDDVYWPCSHSRAIPSFPSQLEWKIALPWANTRGILNSPSELENPAATHY